MSEGGTWGLCIQNRTQNINPGDTGKGKQLLPEEEKKTAWPQTGTETS